MSEQQLNIIFSGGGTGGHIFPAVAIADQVKVLRPDAKISFVGAQGRMEMERIPKAGYPIEGLWISGLQRKLSLDNLMFPFKLLSSLWKADQILRRERPDAVVGTGGYASGPLLRRAAYPGMEKYFPAAKLMEVGNPVREDLLATQGDRAAACAHYGFDPSRPLIMITGGSLGARTLNQALAAAEDILKARPDVQVLWQCGKLYIEQFKDCATAQLEQVKIMPFLDRMDLAFAAADLVISRAGALTIAEICLLGKAVILVPSPNVAEDHQTKNAMALANQQAAVIVKDADAKAELMSTALNILQDETGRQALAKNAKSMAYEGAARKIAEEVLKLAIQ